MTIEGGWSRFRVMQHYYIVPMEWINSWLLESTWGRIAENGREAGRPGLDNVAILRQIARRINDEDLETIDEWDCQVENYSYNDFIGRGGFERAEWRFLYGASGLTDDQRLSNHFRRLRNAARRRKRAVTGLRAMGF